MSRRRACFVLLLLPACARAGAGPAERAPPVRADTPGLEIVVGSAGAVISDRRRVDVPAAGELRFAGVAPILDLGSVQLRSLSDGEGTRALAQRLLPVGAEGARLATLVWQVEARRPGPQLVEATYRTAGLSWRASYTVVIDDAAGRADVSAQVEIDDHAGASFADAQVLIASGDAAPVAAMAPAAATAPAAASAPTSVHAPLAPRLARLPGRVTLAAAAIANVQLFPMRRVPARRALVYDAIGAAGVWPGPETKRAANFPESTTHDVRAFLEVQNDAASGLGLELPAGTVRFFRRDPAGQLVWLDDEQVGDVAVGQHLRVPLGVDTELSGTRRQIAVDIDEERRHLVEEIEIVLVNHGQVAHRVTVVERLARSDHWRLTWSTAAPEKDDTRSARFQVDVPAAGTSKFRYRVMYSW